MNTQPVSDLNQMYDQLNTVLMVNPKNTLCVEWSIDQKFRANQVQTKE